MKAFIPINAFLYSNVFSIENKLLYKEMSNNKFVKNKIIVRIAD